MTTPNENILGELLADPAVIAQVTPLINAAVDERIRPLTAQIEKLTQGVTLIAEASVAQAVQAQGQGQGQQPPPPPGWPPGPEASQPLPPQPQTPAPFGQQPYQPAVPMPPAPIAPAMVDKLAQFAPMLMQLMSGQNQSNSLGNIAETLSAAAQIGNVMNAPMFQGMRMATDLMSLAGRSGIEPTTAAETLGGMIDGQTTNNHHPAPEAGPPV